MASRAEEPGADAADETDHDGAPERRPEARNVKARQRSSLPAPSMPAFTTSRNRPRVIIVIGKCQDHREGPYDRVDQAEHHRRDEQPRGTVEADAVNQRYQPPRGRWRQ